MHQSYINTQMWNTHSSKGVSDAQPQGTDEGIHGGEGQEAKERDGQKGTEQGQDAPLPHHILQKERGAQVSVSTSASLYMQCWQN